MEQGLDMRLGTEKGDTLVFLQKRKWAGLHHWLDGWSKWKKEKSVNEGGNKLEFNWISVSHKKEHVSNDLKYNRMWKKRLGMSLDYQ